jgi:hypothetical protein
MGYLGSSDGSVSSGSVSSASPAGGGVANKRKLAGRMLGGPDVRQGDTARGVGSSLSSGSGGLSGSMGGGVGTRKVAKRGAPVRGMSSSRLR